MARLNLKKLTLTANQWGLYDDARDRLEAANALNQALREAATLVRDEIRVEGKLRGSKLQDAIERALADKWEDVAAQYKKAGAADTECTERAAAALRKLFKATQQEDVGMENLLRQLEEGTGTLTAGHLKRAKTMREELDRLGGKLSGGLADAVVRSDADLKKAIDNVVAAAEHACDLLDLWIQEF